METEFFLGLAIAAITIIWISHDMRMRGIESKFYWVWNFSVVGAFILIPYYIPGIVVVVVSYVIWSRMLYSSSSEKS